MADVVSFVEPGQMRQGWRIERRINGGKSGEHFRGRSEEQERIWKTGTTEAREEDGGRMI